MRCVVHKHMAKLLPDAWEDGGAGSVYVLVAALEKSRVSLEKDGCTVRSLIRWLSGAPSLQQMLLWAVSMRVCR
jgi:hypothetical protein